MNKSSNEFGPGGSLELGQKEILTNCPPTLSLYW